MGDAGLNMFKEVKCKRCGRVIYRANKDRLCAHYKRELGISKPERLTKSEWELFGY